MASNYQYFLNAGFVDDFEEDFDKAVNEVAANGGIYNCMECKKTYKTLGGLQRHNKSKHREEKRLLLDTVVLTDLLRKAAEIVSKDECWSKDTRGSVKDFCCIVDGKLFEEISKLCETFIESNDPEKIFEQFFCNITAKAIQFLNDLPLASATTIMMQLGETVFSYLKSGESGCDSDKFPPSITKTEIDALQYLGGYVVHKLLKKTKNSPKYKSEENQAIILVLESMVDNTREQKLIDSLSRGGLTSISEDCEHIFYKTEELFRKETAVDNLRNIDIVKITSNLMSQSDIISLINSITDISGSNIDSEIRNNLFEKMIQLYLRVRSFSLARDITLNKKKSCAATKGLRKEMKKSEQK